MKKVLSLVLAGLLTASMAVVAGAQEGNENIGTVPFVVDGAAIDGVMDASYANAMVTDVAKGFGADATATAKAYAIHDGENLYVYAEIADADMVECDPAQQESAPWNTDSFEIILDGTNTSADTLYQARVDWSGFPSWYTNLGSKGGLTGYGDAAYPAVQECAAVEIDGGYAIEVALNMPKMAVLPGSKIGIHYQVNDMHADGSAQTVTTASGQGPWDGPNYLEATLAPVEGYISLATFTDGMVIDDDTTQDQGGSGQAIQIMEEYGCGYSSTNDVVGFEDVDFGANGADAMVVRFGYGNDDASVTTLDVMLDDPDGAPIAQMEVGYTGAWTIAGSGYITVPVEIPAGVHSVYLKFTNTKSGSVSEVYFAEAEPAAVEEVVDGGSAPATFDAGVIAAVAAIISAAGYAVSKKH
ncbi:MAG: carbohydrate-binding protein [Clostridia bacterium]|nr:carbohydrate-binding protein [Clostridia bacterium]